MSEFRLCRGLSSFLLHFTAPTQNLLPTLAEFAASDFEVLNGHSVRALSRYKDKQATDALAAALKKKGAGPNALRLRSTAIFSLQR